MTKKNMFETVFPNANKNNGITFVEENLNNKKSWVIVKFNNHMENVRLNQVNKIKIWRDYGDIAWGSAIYEVLDYFDGSYKQAKEHSLTLEV